MTLSATQIIEKLNLEPHPEGGWYRRTFKHSIGASGRGHMTAIYYFLEGNQISRKHKIDSVEIWHWYAGAPLLLTTCPNLNVEPVTFLLGNALEKGMTPQAIVPANTWQWAESKGDWSLVGCTVAPGFTFGTLEWAE